MSCIECGKRPTKQPAQLLEAAKVRARAYGVKHGINELIIISKGNNYGFQTIEENEACNCPIVDRVLILH